MSRNKGLKYFTLCVMNLYNIWVSLSEMSDKKYWLFSWYSHLLRCPCMVEWIKRVKKVVNELINYAFKFFFNAFKAQFRSENSTFHRKWMTSGHPNAVCCVQWKGRFILKLKCVSFKQNCTFFLNTLLCQRSDKKKKIPPKTNTVGWTSVPVWLRRIMLWWCKMFTLFVNLIRFTISSC